MIEREMEYRGSKSVSGLSKPINQELDAVKEQRVDGSWPYRIKTGEGLRCTLMGFERNYPVKIPSKQIKTYSTKIDNNKLNPWFITGFSDAESSFNILIQPRLDSKTKWRVKAIFIIGLNKKDTAILENIKLSFGVGRIYNSGTKVYYRVESFEQMQVIIDHFDKYPLATCKKIDYDLFKNCYNVVKLREHLTVQGLSKLIEYKISLNKGLSKNLKEKFTPVASVARPEYIFNGIPDPQWVAGFTSGDGSFNIKTTKAQYGKTQLRFAINLHIREKEVIIGLANYFNPTANNYLTQEKIKYIYYTPNSVAIQIVNFSFVLNYIIPFFEKYQLHGQKRLDFLDFKKVAQIVNNKEHLTKVGFNKILEIKQGMNLKRN